MNVLDMCSMRPQEPCLIGRHRSRRCRVGRFGIAALGRDRIAAVTRGTASDFHGRAAELFVAD